MIKRRFFPSLLMASQNFQLIYIFRCKRFSFSHFHFTLSHSVTFNSLFVPQLWLWFFLCIRCFFVWVCGGYHVFKARRWITMLIDIIFVFFLSFTRVRSSIGKLCVLLYKRVQRSLEKESDVVARFFSEYYFEWSNLNNFAYELNNAMRCEHGAMFHNIISIQCI